MTNEPLRAGDTIRLADGTTAVVETPTITSYTDSTGTHEGPFVGLLPGFHNVRPEEVVAVVERNPHSCVLCGGGVTSKDPAKYPYCRSCHYTGASAEVANADVLNTLRSLLPDEAEVGIEHTGGGCFWMAVRFPGEPFYWCATEGEASIPDFAKGEQWGLVCRYADDENDDEYDGVILLATNSYEPEAEYEVGNISHEQLCLAITNDRETLRQNGRLS